MSTVTREEFVTELRTWLGTPFKMQGRIKGVSVDCAGLLICTAQVLGLTEFDMAGYTRPRGDLMRKYADEHMDPIGRALIDAADVLLFKWGRHTTHMAVMTSKDTVIHAHGQNMKVVEHHVDDRMWKFLERAYHIRGVA